MPRDATPGAVGDESAATAGDVDASARDGGSVDVFAARAASMATATARTSDSHAFVGGWRRLGGGVRGIVPSVRGADAGGRRPSEARAEESEDEKSGAESDVDDEKDAPWRSFARKSAVRTQRGDGEGGNGDARRPSTDTSVLDIYHRLGEHTTSGRERSARLQEVRAEVSENDEDGTTRESERTFGKNYVVEKSFGMFQEDNPLRKLCVVIVKMSYFDAFILIVIAANTIMLCLDDPSTMDGRGCGLSKKGDMEKANEIAEIIFTVIFSLEAVIKMMAYGVYGPWKAKKSGAYLRDSWNVIDFAIVVVSILAILPGDNSSNLSTLRAIRIIRPLRTISMFPSLRLLIETMLKAFRPLGNVVFFFLLFFCVFGIIGVQFFAGKLKYRCYDTLPSGMSCSAYTAQSVAACVERAGGSAVLLSSKEDQVCSTGKHGLWKCGAAQECLAYANPAYGFISFDNIAWVGLILFQTVTLEYWTPVLEYLMDAVTPAAVVWFIPVIFIGSFVILNLALAIVTMVYDDALMVELQKVESDALKHKFSSGLERMVRALTHSVSVSSVDTMDTAQTENIFIRWRKRFRHWYYESVEPRALKIVESEIFFLSINTIILLNTLTLAMEYDGMSDSYATALERTNLAFTAVFMLEMILKITAFGVVLYVQDRMNWLDAAIVIISAIELGLNSGDGKSRFTVLRALRVFRILKLVRTWESLQKTLQTMWTTVLDLRSFVVILALFVLIFALVGMQLFGGHYCEIDPKPRSNFDTFNNAVVTVLQIINHEDWPLVLYDTMKVVSKLSVVYFVVVLVFGDFIVLNSLIVILLSNFDDRKATLQAELEQQRKEKESKKKGNMFSLFQGIRFARSDSARSGESRDSADGGDKLREKFASMAHELLKREKRKSAASVEDLRMEKLKKMIEEQTAQQEAMNEVLKNPSKILKRERQPGAMSSVPLEKFKHNSFFCIFPPNNRFRRACFTIADDKRFDWLVILVIVASSITMIFETPKNMENDSFAKYADIIDYCFTSAFVAEMLMKWIALGMYNGDKCSYLKNPWNVLDGTIVAIGLLGMGLGSSTDLQWIRALRTLRVLRPLRLIGRIQGLKVVINALLASLPSLGYVLLVSFIVWIIFAIAGMSLFMGKFKSCSDATKLTQADCVSGWVNSTNVARVWDVITSTCNDVSVSIQSLCTGTFNDNTYVIRKWESADSTFDSFPEALLTLFETTAGEGWTVTLYNAVDATTPTSAPVRNKNPLAAWYFITFIIFSNFFLLNMCIGIVIDTFMKISTSSMTRTIMSESQSKWVAQQRAKRFSTQTSFFQKLPTAEWRRKLYIVVRHRLFDTFIMITIALNTLVLMTETSHDGGDKQAVLGVLNYVFTAIFSIEAILKLSAFYPKVYFESWWNCFDFIIVVTSIMGAVMDSGTGSSAFRALRICRVFRMFKQWKSLNTLFNTLVMTLPALGNIALLLALLFFIYAILGMQVFGRVAYGEALNRHSNFKDFGHSLLTLLRMMTGEGWQEIMYDCMNQDACDSSFDCTVGSCCGTKAAPAYFVTFVTFTTFTILNLLIAVVLDNFAMSRKESENQNVTNGDIRAFRKVWKRFDPDLTGFISTTDVHVIVRATPKPLGTKGQRMSDFAMLSFVRDLNLQAGSRFAHYTELLQALTAKAMGVNLNYLPLEIRKELESDRSHSKHASLTKLRARVRRRASVATLGGIAQVPTAPSDESDSAFDVTEREREIADEISHSECLDLDGRPISLSVMLVVLKLQRTFRARQAAKSTRVDRTTANWSRQLSRRS